jgi:hypothetical protein
MEETVRKDSALKKKLQYLYRDIVNTGMKIKYSFTKPTLDDNQQGILEDLKENGLTFFPLHHLLEPHEITELEKSIMEFKNNKDVQEKREGFYNLSEIVEGNNRKEYLIMAKKIYPDFKDRLPLKNMLNKSFLTDIASSYFKQKCKLTYADYWYTLKSKSDDKAVYSQNWHADPEGDKILKVFIYFNDVDSNGGALQYIKGSQQGGKNYHIMSSAKRNTSFYPTDDFIAKFFEENDITNASAPKGTVVLADTRGLHRGGKCISIERLMAVGMFLDGGISSVEFK